MLPYLAVAVVPVPSHDVDTMAVLVPEGTLVGQGAVGDRDVIVIVVGGEGSALMVRQRVT